MTTGPAFELPAGTRVGRVALRAGSIDDLVGFYRDAVGLRVERDGARARLSAGDGTLVEIVEDADAPERTPAEAGLFHLAIRVPDRGALADVLDRVRGSDAAFTGASDHLASEALYLRDPEGNGVEVYRDRPREEWPWTDDGGVALDTLPLNLDDLAADAAGGRRLPPGTDVGHVHLEVVDLDRSEAFYRDALGLRLRTRYGDGGVFLAADDYHHHLGINVWNGRTAPTGDGRGIEWFEFVLPDAGAARTVRDRLAGRGHRIRDGDGDGEFLVPDPDGIGVRLTVGG